MNFVKFTYNGRRYIYDQASGITMDILGRFLLSDVRSAIDSYKKWAFDDNQNGASGCLTSLDKENGTIHLTDMYSEEKVPTKVKITVQQFVQLLDDWQEKVCAVRPKEVIIKHENDAFIIEANH